MRSNDSPYVSLVAVIKKNTVLFPRESEKTSDQPQEKDKTGENVVAKKTDPLINGELYLDIGVKIEKTFFNINSLAGNGEKTEGKTYLDDVGLAFSALYDYMYALNANKESSDYVINKLASPPSPSPEATPIYSIQRMADGMADPFKAHFNKIANDCLKILTDTLSINLEKQWENDVYVFYSERISGRYPQDKTSNIDISFEDFKEFFGKEGKVQVFYDKYLKVLLDPDHNFLLALNKGASFISPEITHLLAQVENIRNAYMDEKNNISITFWVEPTGLSGIYANSILDIDGVQLEYNHGKPSTKSIIWPNPANNSGQVSLTMNSVSANIAPYSKSETGEWSLLRFLDKARNSSISEHERQLRFTSAAGYASYKLTLPKPVNPITGDLFIGFTLPRRLKSAY